MANERRRFVYLSLMARSLAMRPGEARLVNTVLAFGLFAAILIGWQVAVRALQIPDIILPLAHAGPLLGGSRICSMVGLRRHAVRLQHSVRRGP